MKERERFVITQVESTTLLFILALSLLLFESKFSCKIERPRKAY